VRPKPLVEIGRKPLLWHIMQHYSTYGHHHFVLALGYMGEAIKKYMAELSQYEGNLRVDFTKREIFGQENSRGDFDVPNPPWVVDLIDTGVETMTGGRLQMLEPYLGRHLHADLRGRAVECGSRQADGVPQDPMAGPRR
jgi:glucose-1-phosphate cytidylyltransferase